MGRTQRDHDKAGQRLARPDGSRRKLPRTFAEEIPDIASHQQKSPKLQEISDNQEQEQSPGVKSQSCRQSRRLQAIRDPNRRERLTGSPTSTSKGCLLSSVFPTTVVNHDETPRKKDIAQARTSEAQKSTQQSPCLGIKDQPELDTGDEANDHDTKRPRHDLAHHVEEARKQPRTALGTKEFIEDWLVESCWSRRASITNESELIKALTEMSRRPPFILPTPMNSVENSNFTKTHETDYRQPLANHNVYVECEKSPTELMRRAHEVISRPRSSPEMDDAAIQELKDQFRALQNGPEEELVRLLAPQIIPSMTKIPDQRLAQGAHHLWYNSIAIPPKPSLLDNLPLLPRPKPDLAFGYSKAAFTFDQLQTIDLLVDNESGRSYAMPDKTIRFPFLNVEFKSLAKNGTHYAATNQLAGAGAIALNGNLELSRRSFGAQSFDYDEPQFFSVSMDHVQVWMNVHWLKAPAEGGQHSFHVEGLSKHFLNDANSIRSVIRAIKNILDYGIDTRLRKLCIALDAYRETVVRGRETASVDEMQVVEFLSEPRTIQQAKMVAAAVEKNAELAAAAAITPRKRRAPDELEEESLRSMPRKRQMR